MPEWIAVCCQGQCGTYQCIQRPKLTGRTCPTRKFKCRICSKQQSIIQTFAISEQPSDIRRVVQTLNANRAEREHNTDLLTLTRLRERSLQSADGDDDDEDFYEHQLNKRPRYHDSDSDSEAERVFHSRRQHDSNSPIEIPCVRGNDFNPFDPSDDDVPGVVQHDELSFHPPNIRQDNHSLNSCDTTLSQPPTECALTVSDPSFVSMRHFQNSQCDLVDEAELDDLLDSAETMF